MTRAFAVLTVFAVVLSSGVVQGVWTHRWTSSAALERATARMADLPLTLGEWDGEAQALDPRQVEVADISGHLLRRYVNRRTGDMVTVLLLCGRPGPLAVHAPEVCYRGLGYRTVGARAKQPSPAGAGDFWVARLQRERVAGEGPLRIFYAWNATGTWEAADSPRSRFGWRPALYKLYVTRQLTKADEPLEDGPELGFLRALLPAAQKALFPAP